MFSIAGRPIGKGSPVYIIAEVSANHLHDFDRAIAIIDAASEAGADAVKLQTYRSDTITLDVDNEYFRISHGTLWDGRRYYDLYEEAFTPWEWQPKLKAHAERKGLSCFSGPLDPTAVDFLEEMQVPAYKIASFEITDIPLIRYVAEKKKPVIISTGVAAKADIELALDTCRSVGNNQVALLKCTSSYPAPYADMHLRTIPQLQAEFKVPVGLSDHSHGIAVPIASVALGACIVEKHLTLRRADGGPDAEFSLEPEEFKSMVQAVREASDALGDPDYVFDDSMKRSRTFARSLFVAENIAKGERLTARNVRSVRPNNGLHPKYLPDVLGKRAAKQLSKGTPLGWDCLEEDQD
ncbi:MAG: pseudaminic acid synthase [Bdellovibrionales bacterium]|nr:pseudaminic acid synthase [Bdellovibrionales bacterium]